MALKQSSLSPKWRFLAWVALFALAGVISWFGAHSTGVTTPNPIEDGGVQSAAAELDAPELLTLEEADRNEVPTNQEAFPDTDDSTLVAADEDLDEGWGVIQGIAMVNERKLRRGFIRWAHPVSREQGAASFEDGSFKIYVPTGLVHLAASISSDEDMRVEEPEFNSDSLMQKNVQVEVLDGTPSQLDLIWDYPESIIEGDMLGTPSGNPFPDTTLQLTSFDPNFSIKFQTDAAGQFHCTVPTTTDAAIFYFHEGVNSGKTIDPSAWTQIRVPDPHACAISAINHETGELVPDFDLFIREHKEGKFLNPWYRPKTLNESDPSFPGRLIQLPQGRIDLLAHAPRRGLAPTYLTNFVIQPSPDPIELSLKPGGTLFFTCSSPPPTGLRNPGFDPDPILVVEQRMYEWNEPSINQLGARVRQEGKFPRNFLFNRRLSFNLQGEAEVRGLPAGIYRVVHWRKGLNWRSEPLEVVAGVTTNVHLVQE